MTRRVLEILCTEKLGVSIKRPKLPNFDAFYIVVSKSFFFKKSP